MTKPAKPARAKPLAPEERRTSLVEAALPLMLEHGRGVTTKQIADAAGVAEGTIFRVFESKDELITDALCHAFRMEPFLDDLRRIEPDQPLRALVADIVTMLRIRFTGMFQLMAAMALVGPPTARKHLEVERQEAYDLMVRLLEPSAPALSVEVGDFVHRMRLLTFAGSHPHLSDGRPLSVDQIVTTLCDGLLRPNSTNPTNRTEEDR